MIKKHQSDVVDRAAHEWCEFDGTEIDFTEDKTYDWYLANELRRIRDSYSIGQ